ncbi:Hypp2647 [Branchiostoma lanceolatum]|uniref:Hypp2647 protein n=1 Tax=Branchiostoma lanceolatum TaxID=7740 RepID=A0A8K0ERD7_BRALA|nr:Hypp2647 [Branchiostoma lanceolatum]
MERQYPIEEELANFRAVKPALVRRSGGIAGNVQMKKFERDIKLLDEQIRQSEKHFFNEQKGLLTRLDRLKVGRNSIGDQNGRKLLEGSSESGIHRGHLVPRPPNHGGPLLDRRAQLMHKIDQQTARFHKEDKKEDEAFRKTPIKLKPLPQNYKPKLGQNQAEPGAKEPADGESDGSSQESRPSQTLYTVHTAGSSSSYHSATTTVSTLSEPAKRTRKMSYAGLPSTYNNTGQAQSKSWDEAGTTPAKPRLQRRVSLPSRLAGLGKPSSDHLPQAPPEHLHSWLGLRTQATLDRMRGQPKDEMALYQPRGKKKGSF